MSASVPTDGGRAFDDADARDLATALVEAARAAGATWCDAAISFGAGFSASARDGAAEDITRDSWRAAGLRVVVDGRLGLCSAADIPVGKAAVEQMARDAVALARAATPSDHNDAPPAAPMDAQLLAARDAALALWDDDTAALKPGWAVETALVLDRVVRAQAGIAGTKDASAGARRGSFALATSSGFVGSTRGTSVSCSVSAFLDEDGGKKQVEGDFDAARHLGALRPAQAIAQEAATRVLARRGARKLKTERLPVVFAPPMARGFLGSVLATLCGDAIARGRSFLADKLGQQILPAGYALWDDPLLPRGLASRSFDGEGIPSSRQLLIGDDGVLRTFLLDHKSARELGRSSNGHAARSARALPGPAPTNVMLVGGHGDLASIVRDTARGLLVTRLMGRAMDPVTGQMSRAASGFFIDGGALAYPVEEITIAGNVLELLRGLDRIGADPDLRGAIQAPTLRFGEMHVSGS